ncbi:MAG: hypothetical protein E7G18_02645 [Anaerococcus hydrogenalis]|uniref:hypothetical protein n=1 Tax=Anaerococcus hydrogenalis TaxID=33029 RepID=UPI0029065A92|nr:hypothetical protein [Anaerococcus hydrogenalis]MDU3687576.1 hypothetical protein [Anaerococcus hydrogenalis]
MFLKIKVSDKSAIFLNTDFFRICRVDVDKNVARLEIINRDGEEEVFDDIEYSGEFKDFVEGL